MKRSCAVLFFLLLALSVFLPNPIFPAEIRKPSVAVLWFENRTPDRSLNYLNELIPSLISVELSKEGFCTLVEREEIEKALDEVVLSEEGLISTDKRIKKGIAEPADYLISGWFTSENNQLTISVRSYQWRKGRGINKDFQYPLPNISETGKDVGQYLKQMLQQTDAAEVALYPSKQNFSVVIFFDLYRDFVYGDRDAYPYKTVFLQGIEAMLGTQGIDCRVIYEEEAWKELIKKNDSGSVQRLFRIDTRISSYIYSSPEIFVRDFSFTTEPLNWESVPFRTFSQPISEFVELTKQVAGYILQQTSGSKSILPETPFSPKMETLLYYSGFLRQKSYFDYPAALKEIQKALYLYPDFSYYWLVLSEVYGSLQKQEERVEIQEYYLTHSSYEEHRSVYVRQIQQYVEDKNILLRTKKGQKRFLTEVSFLKPLMENVIQKHKEVNPQINEIAVMLSRLCLLEDNPEEKIKYLVEKQLITEDEYEADLCLAFLLKGLRFTNEERTELVNRIFFSRDWSVYRWSEYKGYVYLPDTLIQRFMQNLQKQREFLNIVGESSKKYPQTFVNYYIFRKSLRYFDPEEVKRSSDKILSEQPDSITGKYIYLLGLEERLFSQTKDKEGLIIEIADLIYEVLVDREIESDFIKKAEKSDEETFYLVLREFLKRREVNERPSLLARAPENIRKRLETETFGLKKIESDKDYQTKLFPSINEKGHPSALLSSNFQSLGRLIADSGWKVDFLSKKMSSESLSEYKLIILSLSDSELWKEGKPSDELRVDFLEEALKETENGLFFLLLSKGARLKREMPQLNKFLERFQCYIDTQKFVSSPAIFSSGVIKEATEFHLNLRKCSPCFWQFFIEGYPIYGERGEVLVKSKEEGYPLTVSLPVSGGRFILSGEMPRLFGSNLSGICSLDFYQDLILRNTWRIILSDLSGEKPLLTPLPLIDNLYEARWGLQQDFYTYLLQNPLEPWIKKEKYPLNNKKYIEEQARLTLARYKEILNESSEDRDLKCHCYFWFGSANRYLGNYEEAISYYQKAMKLFPDTDKEGYRQTAVLLIDSYLQKEFFTENDYAACGKIIEEQLKEANPETLYELQGRLEEKMKRYEKAVLYYENMADYVVATSDLSLNIRKWLSEYALFRKAYLRYESGNLSKAKESFTELNQVISSEWKRSGAREDFFAFNTRGGFREMFLNFPCPFEIQSASYLYLWKIAKKEGKMFAEQQEFQKFLADAEKVEYATQELQWLISQLKIIIKEEFNEQL